MHCILRLGMRDLSSGCLYKRVKREREREIKQKWTTSVSILTDRVRHDLFTPTNFNDDDNEQWEKNPKYQINGEKRFFSCCICSAIRHFHNAIHLQTYWLKLVYISFWCPCHLKWLMVKAMVVILWWRFNTYSTHIIIYVKELNQQMEETRTLCTKQKQKQRDNSAIIFELFLLEYGKPLCRQNV